MAYNFIKLSDAPVAEDGATHVLGTKEGQVVRVPASGLGAVALDLEIAGDSAGPTSVLDASTRDANRLAGATLKLPTGEAYTADDSGKFVAEELYAALSDYIRAAACFYIDCSPAKSCGYVSGDICSISRFGRRSYAVAVFGWAGAYDFRS